MRCTQKVFSGGNGVIFLPGCDQIFCCVHHDVFFGHVSYHGHRASLLTNGKVGKIHAANFSSD